MTSRVRAPSRSGDSFASVRPPEAATTRAMAVDGDVVDAVGDDASGGSPLDVRLVLRKPHHLRLDVSFGAVHAVTIGIATGAMASSGLFERAFIVGAGVIIHALVVLSTHWSVAVDAALTCREISPKEASRAAASVGLKSSPSRLPSARPRARCCKPMCMCGVVGRLRGRTRQRPKSSS